MNPSQEMDEIIITTPAFTTGATPHWVAFEKGFFREEGIKVNVEYILTNPGKWTGDLFPGKIVFALGGSLPFRVARKGWDIKVVNIISTTAKAPHVLVARPEIKSVAELKGKRIMAGLRGASYIDASYSLRHFGLDPEKDVTWVASEDKPPDTERARIESLRMGEVDAICSGNPHWYLAVKMGFNYLTSSRDLATWQQGGLSTLRKTVEEHPDVVKRVVRALIKGAEFARLNKEETVDIAARNIIYIDRATLGGCYDEIHNQWHVTAEEESYKKAIEVFSQEWGLPIKPIETYYELRFVREALEELRLAQARVK